MEEETTPDVDSPDENVTSTDKKVTDSEELDENNNKEELLEDKE